MENFPFEGSQYFPTEPLLFCIFFQVPHLRWYHISCPFSGLLFLFVVLHLILLLSLLGSHCIRRPLSVIISFFLLEPSLLNATHKIVRFKHSALSYHYCRAICEVFISGLHILTAQSPLGPAPPPQALHTRTRPLLSCICSSKVINDLCPDSRIHLLCLNLEALWFLCGGHIGDTPPSFPFSFTSLSQPYLSDVYVFIAFLKCLFLSSISKYRCSLRLFYGGLYLFS